MTCGQNIIRIAASLIYGSVLATPAFANGKDNSVRFVWEAALNNADPYFNTSRLGIILADNVWDTLIVRDPETGVLTGDLATHWKWVDDKTLELDLRQGVKFHNGAAFDADDVIYTVGLVTKPGSQSLQAKYLGWIDHVEKRGRYTVRLVAKQPTPAAIAYLASAMAVIHPHDYYAKVGPKGMSEHPIGTGPYRVVEHVLGKSISLERNPDYFTGGPKSAARIDKIDIRMLPDAQTRVAEVIAGGADLIMWVSPDQADQLRGLPSLQVLSGGNTRAIYLQMNTRENTPAPQLRDIRVRKAILHAIDRKTIADYLTGGGARVLHAECYPGQFGCDEKNVPRYAYDPKRAQALLSEAGYPNGFDIDIYASTNRNEVEAIIGYLRAVGIKARLRFLTAPAVRDATRAGKVAISYFVWSGLGNDLSDSVSRFHEFSPDDTNRDPEIRDLLLRGDSTMDMTDRKSSYGKALALIQERAYVAPLYVKPTFYIAAAGLRFKPPADEIPRFYEMSWK